MLKEAEVKKTKEKKEEKQPEAFSNVKKQDESLAQVTQLANPTNVKVDKEGTFRTTKEVKK